MTGVSRPARRPDPAPLETNDVVVVAVGAALWALGLVVLAVLKAADVTEVPLWWLGMCGYGIALGLFGIRDCRRRHEAIDRDAAAGSPRRA